MNELPWEIRDNIASHLYYVFPPGAPGSRIGSLAPISRKWQEHIERQTFSRLSIKSNRLVEFLAIVSGPRRRYLRKLNYRIKASFDEIGEGLYELFLALSVWNVGPDPHLLELRVEAPYSGPDTFFPSHNPVYKIHSIDDFPSVPLIRSLRFVTWWPTTITISDRSWIELASRLPNLEELDAVVNDKQRLELPWHRQNRYDLALTLSKLNTTNLVHFTLYSRDFGYQRTHRPTSNVLLPDGVDHLNFELNNLLLRTLRLRTFRIRSHIPLSPALFHLPDDDDASTCCFPRLELFDVRFAPCAPDGTRYFSGAMDDGTDADADAPEAYAANDYADPPDLDDPDVFDDHSPPRYIWTAPVAATLVPLLVAAGRAVQRHRMPRLREFKLSGPRLWPPGEERCDYVEVMYAGPGVHRREVCEAGRLLPWEAETESPMTYIRARGLEDDPDVADAWSGMGRGGLVRWEDYDDW